MPKLTAESFLSVLKQSGLIHKDQIKRLVTEAQQAGVNIQDSETLSAYFVQREQLTQWQVDKLQQGKHKGFTLGKYRLLRLLGKGGMSSVYLAEHVLMRRRCAIKVLPIKRVNDTSYLARFHREAQAVASLDHPNIVRAYDIDHEVEKDTEIHFLVMEYVNGRSLQEVVKDAGVLSFESTAAYISQAALGLDHAHKAGLVHRDVKPGNLLIDTNGVVKLLDLGLALFAERTEENPLTVTYDEKVLGTADYLSPEQALDSHLVDLRADIYSLGCTIYYCVTGHPPFKDGTLAQRLMWHQTKDPPSIAEDRPDVPESFLAIVKLMMAKKPDERYQSMAQVADALISWLHSNASPEFRQQWGGLMGAGSGTSLSRAAQIAEISTPAPEPTPAAPEQQPVEAAILPFAAAEPSTEDSGFGDFFQQLQQQTAAPLPPPQPAVAPTPARVVTPPTPVVPAPQPVAAVAPPPSAGTMPWETPNEGTNDAGADSSSGVFDFPTATPGAPENMSDTSSFAAPAPIAPMPMANPQQLTQPVAAAAPAAPAPAVAQPVATPAPLVAAVLAPAVAAPVVMPAAAAPAIARPVVAAPVAAMPIPTAPQMIPAAPIATPAVAVAAASVVTAAPVAAVPVAAAPAVRPAAAAVTAAPVVSVAAAPVMAQPVAAQPIAAQPVTAQPVPAAPALVAVTPVAMAMPATPVVAETPPPFFSTTEDTEDDSQPFSWANETPVAPAVAAPMVAQAVPVAAVPGTAPVAQVAYPVGQPVAAAPVTLPPAPSQAKRMPVKLIGVLAAVLLIAGVGGFMAMNAGDDKKPSKKPPTTATNDKKDRKKESAPTAVAGSPAREPKPKPAPEPSKPINSKVIDVGPDGHFREIWEALSYLNKERSKYTGGAKVGRPSVTIAVAGGQTYEGFGIDNHGGQNYPSGIHIIARGARAKIKPRDDGLCVRLISVENFRLENFDLDSPGKDAVMEIVGYATGMWTKLSISGYTKTGIRAEGFAAQTDDTFIQDVDFRGSGNSAVGIQFNKSLTSTRFVTVKGCRFIGPHKAGVELTASAKQMQFRENIFDHGEVGISFAAGGEWEYIMLANNTFFGQSRAGIRLAGMPSTKANNLVFHRNLFAQVAGPEMLVEKDLQASAMETYLFNKGSEKGLSENWSDRKEPAAEAKGEFELITDPKRREGAISFASTDAKSPDFLALAAGSPAGDVPNQSVMLRTQSFIGAKPRK